VAVVTESGLYLDLTRMVSESMDRALRLNRSWSTDHVYVTPLVHRMHTVCSTLEALGYCVRLYGVSDSAESAWRLTPEGLELYDDLCREFRKRREG